MTTPLDRAKRIDVALERHYAAGGAPRVELFTRRFHVCPEFLLDGLLTDEEIAWIAGVDPAWNAALRVLCVEAGDEDGSRMVAVSAIFTVPWSHDVALAIAQEIERDRERRVFQELTEAETTEAFGQLLDRMERRIR